MFSGECLDHGVQDRRSRVHLFLLASFVPAVLFAILRYDLWSLEPTLRTLDFESLGDLGGIRSSDLSLGIDYLFHVITTFIILHNICVFLSARYRNSEVGPALLSLLNSIASFWVLVVFLPPHGVLAEYLDDVLIYPAIIVAIANVATSMFGNGRDRIVSMSAGLAMFALIGVNALGHIAISKPSEGFLRHQRAWMAASIATSGDDVAEFCQKNGYVCVTRGPDGRERRLSEAQSPGISEKTVENIVSAARKYRILDAPMASGAAFDIRHGALTTDMGIMRYTAFLVSAQGGERVVAIDALASSEAMLWFHTLFGVLVVVSGSVLIVLIAVALRFAHEAETSMKAMIVRHRSGATLMAGGVLSIGSVAAFAYYFSDGLSLESMDVRQAVVLTQMLGMTGLWLTMIPLVVFALIHVPVEDIRRRIPAALLLSLGFAICASALLATAGLKPPVEGLSLLNGIVGLLVLFGANDRRYMILAGCCVCIALTVLSSWWVIVWGGTRVSEVAISYSRARGAEAVVSDMDRVMQFAPHLMKAAMYVGTLPIISVLVFASLAVATSLPRKYARRQPLFPEPAPA